MLQVQSSNIFVLPRKTVIEQKIYTMFLKIPTYFSVYRFKKNFIKYVTMVWFAYVRAYNDLYIAGSNSVLIISSKKHCTQIHY